MNLADNDHHDLVDNALESGWQIDMRPNEGSAAILG
jgi:hypothetical protein